MCEAGAVAAATTRGHGRALRPPGRRRVVRSRSGTRKDARERTCRVVDARPPMPTGGRHERRRAVEAVIAALEARRRSNVPASRRDRARPDGRSTARAVGEDAKAPACSPRTVRRRIADCSAPGRHRHGHVMTASTIARLRRRARPLRAGARLLPHGPAPARLLIPDRGDRRVVRAAVATRCSGECLSPIVASHGYKPHPGRGDGAVLAGAEPANPNSHDMADERGSNGGSTGRWLARPRRAAPPS